MNTIVTELRNYAPQIAGVMDELAPSFFTDKEKENLRRLFPTCEKISIDYAVMEKTSKGMIVKLNSGWDDVGSWSALYDISKKDENQNVVKGEDVITLDTTSSYIRGGKRTIATIGLDDVVIVDSDDALLVAAKGKIQDVKKVAEIIKGR